MTADTTPESKVDVLVIGAGPAGLWASLCLSRYGISVRHIDKRGTKIFRGQADSLQPRTNEIMESFGILHPFYENSCHIVETRFWESSKDGIKRTSVIKEHHPGNSRFHHSAINQGATERLFIDTIQATNGTKVERGVMPLDLRVDQTKISDQSTYPVTLTLKHLTDDELPKAQTAQLLGPVTAESYNLPKGDERELKKPISGKEGTTEIVHAKYVIGCDGASSWTRRYTGIEFEGDSTDNVWCVIDMLCDTDFPDTQTRTVLTTPSTTGLVIGREKGIVRIALDLGTKDRESITPDECITRANEIFAPYYFKPKDVNWYAIFQSAHRVAKKFSVENNRVFIAGDACHTHTPKAGVGMNFSVHDTYNLTWKLAQVIKGLAKPTLLDTYESERRPAAIQLIDFDIKFTESFIEARNQGSAALGEMFKRVLPFTSGIAIDYNPSPIVAAKASKAHLAERVILGRRLQSQPVMNQLSGRPLELQQRFVSDGRYRILVFAGDISDPEQMQRVQCLGKLLNDEASFIRKHTPKTAEIDEVFELLTIHRAPRAEVEVSRLPKVLVPEPKHKEWVKYESVYADSEPCSGDLGGAYQGYGIDVKRGCLIALRPDSHVFWIGDLEDVKVLEDVLDAFLITQKQMHVVSVFN